MSCHINQEYLDFLNDKISSFILNGAWSLPLSFQCLYPDVSKSIFSTSLLIDHSSDQVIWASCASGFLTSSEAYELFCPSLPILPWGKRIWHASIQPRKSLATWKIIQNRVLTENHLQRMNVQLCSRCYLCHACVETSRHMFMDCLLVGPIWNWLFSLFRITVPQSTSLQELFLDDLLVSFTHSSKLLWYLSICNLLWCLWFERNTRRNKTGWCCQFTM